MIGKDSHWWLESPSEGVHSRQTARCQTSTELPCWYQYCCPAFFHPACFGLWWRSLALRPLRLTIICRERRLFHNCFVPPTGFLLISIPIPDPTLQICPFSIDIAFGVWRAALRVVQSSACVLDFWLLFVHHRA